MSNFDYNSYLIQRNLCSKNYNLIPGPEGAKGPQGATGSRGVQGLTGARGPQGAQGACCVGAQGAQGPQGSQGPSAGPTGATGPIGPPGQGYAVNQTYNVNLTIQNDLTTPALSESFGPFTGSPTIGGKWAISWSIFESIIADPSNQFYITFSTGSIEYPCTIYTSSNPFYLNNNGTNTSGSGNDIIDFGFSSSTSYTLNIYQSSSNYPGSQPDFNLSVTLISLN